MQPEEIKPLAVYTTEQAAVLLSMNIQTVQKYIREKKIKAVKVGVHYRVTGKALLDFLGVKLPK